MKHTVASSLARTLLVDFLEKSWPAIEKLVRHVSQFNPNSKSSYSLYVFRNGKKHIVNLNGKHYFLRSSVEYSNPQLTVEEAQGIIAARLLETCGNHFHHYGLKKPGSSDVNQMLEALQNPSEGPVKAFLLNTDDAEPDRYSMNPLKESIVATGQSAFPSANVKTEGLKLDENFVTKYLGTLISQKEAELIGHYVENWKGSYVDMVDALKYEQMDKLSETFSLNLNSLPAKRMPIETLREEDANGLLHHIIKEVHRNHSAFTEAYRCMGRSIRKRTTLLTVPHSAKGYGSKRAARGKIYFENQKLASIKVTYKTTLLYPNAIDPNDTSIAKAEGQFTVEGQKLTSYSFKQTPSSPQFFLYSLASPENAALWHGIGAYAAKQLLKSYTSIRTTCQNKPLIRNLENYNVTTKTPLQLNLDPQNMWVHPKHRNIDASIGCIENPEDLAKMGMKIQVI